MKISVPIMWLVRPLQYTTLILLFIPIYENAYCTIHILWSLSMLSSNSSVTRPPLYVLLIKIMYRLVPKFETNVNLAWIHLIDSCGIYQRWHESSWSYQSILTLGKLPNYTKNIVFAKIFTNFNIVCTLKIVHCKPTINKTKRNLCYLW